MTIENASITESAKEDYDTTHKRVFRIAFDCLTRCWPPEHTVEYFKGKALPICAVAFADMGDNALGKEIIMEIYKYLETSAAELQSGVENLGQ